MKTDSFLEKRASSCSQEHGRDNEMASGIQQADVCILCALYEEASAVVEEFSTRCGRPFTQAFYGLNKLEYRYATILNKHSESLTICVTWLSHMGSERTALNLVPLLHEFRPRF